MSVVDSRTFGALIARVTAGIVVLAALIAPGVSRAADPAPPTPTDTLLTNGSWSNGAIWSKGSAPGPSDDVDLNSAHATIDGPVEVHSLNMDDGALFGSAAGATLTIGSGAAVTGGLWAPDGNGGIYKSNLDLPTTVDGPAYIHTLSVIPPQFNALPSSTDTASLDLGGASAIEPSMALGAVTSRSPATQA